MQLNIKTPRWSLPLLDPKRYKGAKGGRGSGKSHTMAENLVEIHVMDKDYQSVCIREVQKSLKFSAKKLIEDKIKTLGVSHLFQITLTEIRRIGGDGVIIFQGMQDHTAESIKSLEGFDLAWVEEAQSISAHSMKLLLPTIRKPKSEIWFSWNPDQETDPVEQLFKTPDDDMVCIHVNYLDNPFCPEELIKEAERHRRNDPDTFDHVWLGGYNTKSEAIVFSGKFKIEEFDESTLGDPLHGLDWGFSQDPTAAVECYVSDHKLYIRREAGKIGLDLDDTPSYIIRKIPTFKNYVSRADCARPESISYCKKHGLPNMTACKKWTGSVEDGISHMRMYDKIVIHPECKETAQEFRLYSYKVDKRTGDVLPDIIDKNNHYMDGIRYALGPLIKQQGLVFAI